MLVTSILVPSYRRPAQLLRCLQSLERQTVKPNEVIVAWQGDDDDTRDACEGRGVIPVHSAVVGIVAAENAALRQASGDVIMMIDDDAVAPPDWIEHHLRHYRDPSVGAVGGPADNYHPDGSPFPKRASHPVGHLSWHGKLHGNMFDQDPNWKTKIPEEVDHVVGYNLSFRRSTLQAFETQLKPYWQMFELDACLRIRARGYKVLFDYANSVEHHPTNTAYTGGRQGDLAVKIFNGAYNHAFVLAKHSRHMQVPVRLLYLLLVGTIGSPGLAATVLAWRRYGNAALEARILWSTWRYRLRGWRAGARARKLATEASFLTTSKV